MLRLDNIKKDYLVAGNYMPALKGINLSFRKNEFVSILGPSGCGKTTMLNIIGGLDKYTDGNLYIQGKSTKEFNDRDWDVYRNHRIGFIFQSYNLIPHQTILGNVELALTIAGIDKQTRTEMAKKALDRVGLKDQYNKRPNQLSGGQCQRVAIARALVNEPDILLADEPTGALDTQTSVQIMELIKEISKEKLVIMVTHNPELAYEYSNRIIKLKDGLVIDDSNPFSSEDEIKEVNDLEIVDTNNDKAKMSFVTAFKLSAQNLFTKKSRTILTCVAGSIGIIGISMVLAVSSGVKGYIKSMQDDMLSGNPISIEETAFNLDAMTNMMSVEEKVTFIKNANEVGVDFAINEYIDQFSKMTSLTVSNDISENYINYIKQMPEEFAACVMYDYGINVANNIYVDFTDLNNTQTQSSITYVLDNYAKVLSKVDGLGQFSSYIPGLAPKFRQAPNNEEYILSQYDVLDGKIATNKDEIMLVVDSDKNTQDLLMAELGYYTQEEFIDIAIEANKDNSNMHNDKKKTFSYEELKNHKFTWYANKYTYRIDQNSTDRVFFNYNQNVDLINQYNPLINDGKVDLKVVGILKPKEDINYGCLRSGFYYTESLAEYIIDYEASNKDITPITKMIENLNGNPMQSGHYVMNDEMGNVLEEYDYGITFNYDFTYYADEATKQKQTEATVGFIGSENQMSSMMQMMGMTNAKTYSLTLREVGGVSLPNSIKIYPNSFEEKDKVTNYLDLWNNNSNVIIVNGEKLTDRSKITYTDSVGMIISMINVLINVITYALIAFTALSLVVSCVMIAIITYVSVMERVKEIGVIRSLGGRKKDVSHLFNAETFIIGAMSGIVGILFTYILSFIANLIIGNLSGITTICSLPISQAIIMIALSILLTVISGLVPSRSAAKKNPVEALRTE